MRRKQFPDRTDWLSFFETWPDEGFERDMPIEYQDLTFGLRMRKSDLW